MTDIRADVTVAQKLRCWAVEQDKSERAANEDWAAQSHADTASFFRQAANTLTSLIQELGEAKAVSDHWHSRCIVAEANLVEARELLALIAAQREALPLRAQYVARLAQDYLKKGTTSGN